MCCGQLHPTWQIKKIRCFHRKYYKRLFFVKKHLIKLQLFYVTATPPSWWHMSLVTHGYQSQRSSDRPVIENLYSSFCCIWHIFSLFSSSQHLLFAHQGITFWQAPLKKALGYSCVAVGRIISLIFLRLLYTLSPAYGSVRKWAAFYLMWLLESLSLPRLRNEEFSFCSVRESHIDVA